MSADILPFPKPKIWERIPGTMLVLHRPTGMYYIRKKKVGRGELFKPTGFKTLGKAKAAAQEMYDAWAQGKISAQKRQRVSSVVAELLSSLEREHKTLVDGHPIRSAATLEHDRYYARIITKLFGEQFIDQITEAWWDSYVKSAKRDRTLGDLAKYLSKTHSFAFRRGYVAGRQTFRNPDRRKQVGVEYTDKQIRSFYEHAEPLLKDMIALGAVTGMRPEELDALEWEFVRFEKGRTVISLPEWYVKCGPGREFEVPTSAAEALRRRKGKTNSRFVFPSPTDEARPVSKKHRGKMWRRMLIASGVIKVRYETKKGTKDKRGRKVLVMPDTPFKFHYFRHTFCTRALTDEKKLAKVAAYVGNSPKILFERYFQKSAARTSEIAGTMSGLGLDDEE